MKFNVVALTLAVSVLRPSVLAFTAPNAAMRQSNNVAPRHQRAWMTQVRQAAPSPADIPATKFAVGDLPERQPRRRGGLERALAGSTFAVAMSLVGPCASIAEYMDPDDVGEIVSSDLPPMWVPLALGVVLTAGISLLQGSLGDVMNDEAKLGSLSGARAAKQSARDRNMFKKK
eukprot:jgi/Undpi1/5925/HiC_scaffold_2.g01199.m1